MEIALLFQNLQKGENVDNFFPCNNFSWSLISTKKMLLSDYHTVFNFDEAGAGSLSIGKIEDK